MAATASALASSQIPLPHFMIALVLLKSKPVTLSVEEYLARLRLYVRTDRHQKYNPFAYRHLDSTAYRANVQTEAQKTLFSLQARVAELEGKSQNFPAFKVMAPEGRDRDTTISPGKRKRKTSDPGNRPKKLARQSRVANSSSPMQARPNNLQKISTMSEGIGPEAFTDTVRIPKDAFLHHVYMLQEMIQNPSPEAKLIAICLERSLEVAGQIACSAKLQESPSPAAPAHRSAYDNHRIGPAEPSFSVYQKISKLLPMLHQAMDRLEEANDEHTLEGVVIYKFVKLYEDILSHVCKLWKSSEYAQEGKISDSGEERKLIRNQTQDSEAASQRQPRIILDLCDLAIAMTTTLNPGKRIQLCMLEGCLSILLKMIGSGLKSCVFENASFDTNDDSTRNAQADEVVGRALREQNPHLVYILQRAPSPRAGLSFQHLESTLLTLAKKKFQHTLLNSIFGENALGLLKPSLDMPEPPTELRQVGGDEAVKARDWYKSEVWQLVGWDVLEDYLRQPVKRPKTSTSS